MRGNTHAAGATQYSTDPGPRVGGIGGLLNAATDFINSSAALVVLEGRLAVLSVIVMLAAGVIAAMLLVSVWLFLLAAIAFSLVRAGWPWEGVLVGMAIANIVAAGACAFLIRHLSRNLLFTATRRTLLRKPMGASHDRAQTHVA
ncbi:MAG: hypothetical protein H0V62_12895 [Gammaproteobacteria bacterium]|nr:hypothetical protein [Gammaproteobacteria bacterium]